MTNTGKNFVETCIKDHGISSVNRSYFLQQFFFSAVDTCTETCYAINYLITIPISQTVIESILHNRTYKKNESHRIAIL